MMRMALLCVRINLHKFVLHGHTANTLTYLFQRHVRDAKIIPRYIGGLLTIDESSEARQGQLACETASYGW